MFRINEEVKPWGRVMAIGNREGERYYMFIDGKGSISLVPEELFR